MNDDDKREQRMLYNIANSIIRYQRITFKKRQLMKRRAKNVEYYFTNNRRVIDRVKRDKFNATRY
jgi:hypothetical protein